MNGTRKHSTNSHVAAGTTAFRDRFREAYTIKTGPPPISRMSVAMKAAKSRLGVIRNAQSNPLFMRQRICWTGWRESTFKPYSVERNRLDLGSVVWGAVFNNG